MYRSSAGSARAGSVKMRERVVGGSVLTCINLWSVLVKQMVVAVGL